jgi:hypothetical protein
MTRKAQRQVHPAASAFIILLVLAGVQAVWWRFLVYRPPAVTGSGRQTMGPPGEAPAIIVKGRSDVIVTMAAGDQEPGDADGPGYAARFDRPTGLAMDIHGNLLVADTGNHRIRQISPSGVTTTIAGGDPGYADGPALQARFNAPCGLCVGPDDSIYVADTGNNCLRRIQNGVVTTLKTGGAHLEGASTPVGGSASMVVGVAYRPGAKPGLLVADTPARKLRQFRLDGTPESERTLRGGPVSVSGDSQGTTVAESGMLILGAQTLQNVPIESVEAMNAKQARALSLRHPIGLCRLGARWLVTDSNFGAVFFIVNGKAQVVAGFCSSAGPIRGHRDGDGVNALFGTLCGIVSDGKRYAYVADTANNTIRRLDISQVPAH